MLKKAAREVLLLCTTADISPENRERLSCILAGGIDWEYLWELVEFHNITPLVAHNLVTDGFCNQIPQPYLKRLEQVYHGTLYRNVVLSTELINVMSAFSQRGIKVVPLKGTVLAEILYRTPALRAIADMDILVHPDDIPQAASLLGELGYQKIPEKPHWDHHFHEPPYCKQAAFPIFLELHWALEDGRLATIPEQEIWRRAWTLEHQGISTTVLSPEDNLLFLSNHLSKHSSEQLKFLGDITELVKRYQDMLDWDHVVTSARSWQIDIAVYYTLRRARDLLGAPIPATLFKKLKPSLWRRWLLDFLLNQECLVTPIKGNRVRDWTAVLTRSLMMKHLHQALTVLTRQQGGWKRTAWLRITFWVTLVLVAAMWRNAVHRTRS